MIAPESANNGVTSGTLMPVLALGIPGGTTGAIMMIVLTYHGVVLGPRLFIEKPELAYGVFVQMAVCYCFMALMILPLARYMSRVVWVPTKYPGADDPVADHGRGVLRARVPVRHGAGAGLRRASATSRARPATRSPRC